MIGEAPRRLSDGVVTLREIEPGDLRNLYEWRMDPRNRTMFRSAEAVSFEDHRHFVQRYFRDSNRDQWFIVEVEGSPVGTIALYDFDPGGKTCEWGRLVIDPARRGAGYARRALALLIDHCRRLGVEQLRCEVLQKNLPALGLYTSTGFREEGEDRCDGRTFLRMTLALGLRRA